VAQLPSFNTPRPEAGYPNLRPVKWLRAVSRSHFTQGALYEIGSAMSLFLIKNYAEEFRAALEGKAVIPDCIAGRCAAA
jgi:restriction system protein